MTSSSSKAQLGVEGLWVVIVLVVIGLGLIYGYSAFDELNDDIQNDLDLSDEARQASETVIGNFPSNWDNVFFFLFILLWAFLVVAAYLADTAPVMLIFSIVLIVLGLVVTMMLSNMYEEATSLDDTMQSFSDAFPKMNWLLTHILMVMIVVSFSVMLVLYGRTR